MGPTIGLAVVATGNHFVFDIVAGVVAAALGYALGTALSQAGGSPHPGVAPRVRRRLIGVRGDHRNVAGARAAG